MLDIREFEAMAKLVLPENERVRLSECAENLIGGFGALDTINTENTQPLVTVLNLHNVLREDISEKLLSRDELLSNAPEQYDGFFKVPGTLE